MPVYSIAPPDDPILEPDPDERKHSQNWDVPGIGPMTTASVSQLVRHVVRVVHVSECFQNGV